MTSEQLKRMRELAEISAPFHNESKELQALALKALAELEPLEELRQDEGTTVELICTRPDYDPDQPDEIVTIHADWTGWVRKRFYGPTLSEALAAAAKAKRREA